MPKQVRMPASQQLY